MANQVEAMHAGLVELLGEDLSSEVLGQGLARYLVRHPESEIGVGDIRAYFGEDRAEQVLAEYCRVAVLTGETLGSLYREYERGLGASRLAEAKRRLEESYAEAKRDYEFYRNSGEAFDRVGFQVSMLASQGVMADVLGEVRGLDPGGVSAYLGVVEVRIAESRRMAESVESELAERLSGEGVAGLGELASEATRWKRVWNTWIWVSEIMKGAL